VAVHEHLLRLSWCAKFGISVQSILLSTTSQYYFSVLLLSTASQYYFSVLLLSTTSQYCFSPLPAPKRPVLGSRSTATRWCCSTVISSEHDEGIVHHPYKCIVGDVSVIQV
jgi:hypothetical protein